MSFDNLPSVLVILLPGFLASEGFFWAGKQRGASDLQRLMWSLTASIVLLMPLATIWHVVDASSPSFANILSDPDQRGTPWLLLLSLYIIAFPVGVGAGRIDELGLFTPLMAKIGIDLKRHDDVWWVVLRKPMWVVVRLKDGSMLYGWPATLTQESEAAELYLSPVQVWNPTTNQYVAQPEVDGIWVSASSISRMEIIRRPEQQPASPNPAQPPKPRWAT